MPMAWSLITLLLVGFGLFHGTGAAREENLPSAQVVGTVLCTPCYNRGFSRTRQFISGASVLLECADLGFRKEVMSDERGKFEVRLPPSTSEDAEETQGCTLKLIKSSNPGCDVESSQASLRLKLNMQGPQVHSVGVLAFTPREQPSSCARRPTWRGLMESGSKKGLINQESARRASKTSDYPPPAVTPWWSISKPATAPVTSPPVLGSTELPPSFYFPIPPLPPFHFPPTPSLPLTPSHFFPFAPLPQPPGIHFQFPPLPQPPAIHFQFPPLPQPPAIHFRFPPLPQPPAIHFQFPPFPQPTVPSPSTSLPPEHRFRLPPLPFHPPTIPFPLAPFPGLTPPPPAPSPYF